MMDGHYSLPVIAEDTGDSSAQDACLNGQWHRLLGGSTPHGPQR